jgi:hypothetical protein
VAGISGLAFAQGLLKTGIPFRIFERDPDLNVRSQGYRVRLNTSGIDALNQVLPPHLSSQLKASCAHNTSHLPLHLNAITGEKSHLGFYSVKQPPQAGGGEESLNADRSVVRSVLMKGMEEFVEFGKEFLKYEITPRGITVLSRTGARSTGSYSLVQMARNPGSGSNSFPIIFLWIPRAGDFTARPQLPLSFSPNSVNMLQMVLL